MIYNRLLIIFIILNPIITNINGLSIKYFNKSILGPIFYSLFFLIFTAKIITTKNIKGLQLILFSLFFFIISFYTQRSLLPHINYMIKIIFPIILFLLVKNQNINYLYFKKIIKSIMNSAVIYSSFIFFTFLIDFKYYSFKQGYYGFVHALNDLTVYLLIIIFFIRLIRGKNKKYEIMCYCSLALIKSKVLLVLPILIFKYFKKKQHKYMLFFIVPMLLVFLYSKDYFIDFYQDYFKDSTSIISITDIYDQTYINRTLTFGRSTYWEMILENYDKNELDYVIGSGIEGAKRLTFGKIGTEMDLFDAFNIYGIIGLIILFFFYYIPILKLKIPIYSKIDFLIVIFYSIFGGHFYNNPLCNIFYGIILGLLYNKNQQLVGVFFEIHNDNKHTSTLQRKDSQKSI